MENLSHLVDHWSCPLPKPVWFTSNINGHMRNPYDQMTSWLPGNTAAADRHLKSPGSHLK